MTARSMSSAELVLNISKNAKYLFLEAKFSINLSIGEGVTLGHPDHVVQS